MESIKIIAALLWTFKAGAPADAPPVVAGDVVYYACPDKQVYALALPTGKRLWAKGFKAPLNEIPAVDEGRLYVYVPLPAEELQCWDLLKHKRLWRVRAGPGRARPAACGGLAAIGGRNYVAIYNGRGDEVGRARLTDTVAGVAAAGGGFLAWTTAGEVAFVEGDARGEPAWVTTIAPGELFATVRGECAWFAGSGGDLVTVDVQTGREIRRVTLGEPLIGAPDVGAGAAVVAGRRTVFGVSAEDGTTRWRFAPGGNVIGAAAYREGAVVAAENGTVYYADANGSCEIAKLKKYAAAAPVVVGDKVLLADGEKRVLCYEIR